MGTSRRLKAAAIERTVEALADFRIAGSGLGRHAIGRSPPAPSGRPKTPIDFVAEAGSAGIEVDVISGIQEARLVMDGIGPTVSNCRGDLIVIDIGGGSTEFIHAVDGNVSILSAPISVSFELTELLLAGDPPTTGRNRSPFEFCGKKDRPGI